MKLLVIAFVNCQWEMREVWVWGIRWRKFERGYCLHFKAFMATEFNKTCQAVEWLVNQHFIIHHSPYIATSLWTFYWILSASVCIIVAQKAGCATYYILCSCRICVENFNNIVGSLR